MPTITTNQTDASGLDVASFIALASDPAAYKAKLDELNTATAQAKAARVELVKAKDIDALLTKTREEAKLANNLVTDAQNQANNIIAQANADAARILADANAKSDIMRIKLEEEAKRADARAADLQNRAKIIEAEISGARTAQEAANALAAVAKSTQAEAETEKQAAVEKLKFIQSSFAAFVSAVTK